MSVASSNSSVCSRDEHESSQYLRQLLTNIINFSGVSVLTRFMSRTSKLSLSKVVKALQMNYSPDDWMAIKKLHRPQQRANKKE